jgi:hypothetical protein
MVQASSCEDQRIQVTLLSFEKYNSKIKRGLSVLHVGFAGLSDHVSNLSIKKVK